MVSTHKNIVVNLASIDNLPVSFKESLEEIFKSAPDEITEFDNTQEMITKL
jgi:hypothetical protein